MDDMFNLDEAPEAALDSFIEAFGEEILEDESKTSMINPGRYQQINLAYAMLKRMMEGTGAKVSYELHQPFKSMGSVSVEGKLIEFQHPMLFSKVAALAHNTEVYPLSKNAVRLTFTFHNLTTHIE